MKLRLFIAISCSVFLCGCAPVLIRYKHVIVSESATLKVVERSTESNDAQGKPLSGRKIGLPTRSALTGNGYVVTILTPMNSAPMLFLKVEDQNRKALDLRGAHLHLFGGKFATGSESPSYFFNLKEAAKDSIEFDVITGQGVILGHEKIKYDVVSRGYVWAIDAL